MNYTEEETRYMVSEYTSNPTRDTVEALALLMIRSTKSIIGKLSREGVYQRAAYKSKSGHEPVTKVELVNTIANNLDLELEILVGLEKAPKHVLKHLELATGAQRD
jgi:hypothetical protein